MQCFPFSCTLTQIKQISVIYKTDSHIITDDDRSTVFLCGVFHDTTPRSSMFMFIRDCYCASMPTTQACKGREASTRVKWGAEQRNRIVEEAPNSTCIGRSLAETGQVETDIYCGRVHVQGCHSPLLILFSFRVGHLVLYGRLPILSARETFLSVCYWYWQDLNKNPSPLFPKRTEWQP